VIFGENNFSVNNPDNFIKGGMRILLNEKNNSFSTTKDLQTGIVVE